MINKQTKVTFSEILGHALDAEKLDTLYKTALRVYGVDSAEGTPTLLKLATLRQEQPVLLDTLQKEMMKQAHTASQII